MSKKKIGRNSLCYCGSTKKYKKCCLMKNNLRKRLEERGITFKNIQDREGLRRAGKLVVDTLSLVEREIREGISTDFINGIVHDHTIENGAIPAPLNYRGYPKSVCISVNDVVCHGIPSDRILLNGDIVNVDVTSILDGYYADASKSFFVGKPGYEAKCVLETAKKCLLAGISAVKPGNTTHDIGRSVQDCAESNGCSVVREFVGHGIGKNFHEPPQIPHYRQFGQGIPLLPNMVFTIEPMVNFGKKEIKILNDGWTAVTCDGSLSAQFEQTLCVTESGCDILTPYNL